VPSQFSIFLDWIKVPRRARPRPAAPFFIDNPLDLGSISGKIFQGGDMRKINFILTAYGLLKIALTKTGGNDFTVQASFPRRGRMIDRSFY
jgi:hypothetical protein